MLPQKYRLPLTPNFKLLGARTSLPSGLIISSLNHGNVPRLGVIISKKALSLAVDRNRLKRRLHGLFIAKASSLSPIDYLIIVKSNPTDAAYKNLFEACDRLWQPPLQS